MKARLLLDLLTPCIGHQHIDPYLGRVSKRHDKKYLGSRKALVTKLRQLVIIIRVRGSSFGEFFIVLEDTLESRRASAKSPCTCLCTPEVQIACGTGHVWLQRLATHGRADERQDVPEASVPLS